MIARTYIQTAGEGRIAAQLMVDNPMIQGFAAMLGNPAVIAGQPGMERVRIGRDNAIMTWNPQARTGELTLLLGRAMIKLDGSGLDEKDPLVALIRAWDIERLKELTRG